jgi:putative nucleotidyltransferase with HDIG domain
LVNNRHDCSLSHTTATNPAAHGGDAKDPAGLWVQVVNLEPSTLSGKPMTQLSVATRIAQLTGDLPPMPHIARLVMEKVADPSTSGKQLQDIISQDQALAARILKIANSAFYGLSRSITSLTTAISTIGFNTIKSLVISSAMRDLFRTFGLTEQLLWEHSLGCAFSARMIAKRVKFPKVEEVFLAGLLHDIGKVILNLKVPEQVSIIIQDVYNNPGTTFLELEQSTFGFDHAQLGRLVAHKWNFAAEIEEAIGCHHQPSAAETLPAISYITHLGNAFCHKLQIGPTKNPELDVAGLDSARFLKLDAASIAEVIEEVGVTFDAEKANFLS